VKAVAVAIRRVELRVDDRGDGGHRRHHALHLDDVDDDHVDDDHVDDARSDHVDGRGGR
jgi:hypothetical protein